MGVNNMSGSTYLDWDLIEKTVGDLQVYSANDNELACFTSLKSYLDGVNAKHCNYLGDLPNWLDPNNSQGPAGYCKELNKSYNSFVSKINGVLDYRGIDSNGGVSGSTGAGSSGYGSTGTGSSGYGSAAGTTGGGAGGSSSSSPTPHVSGTGTAPKGTMPSGQKQSYGTGVGMPNGGKSTSSGTGSNSSSTNNTTSTPSRSFADTVRGSIGSSLSNSTISSAGGAVAAAGGALGSLASRIGDVGGLGGASTSGMLNSINYPMGNYSTSENFNASFSQEEKENLASVLEKNGYSKDDIDSILNGEYGTSQLLVDSVSGELGDLIKANPDVRNQIIEQYGFDVFNEDGTVNNDKLSMALFVDDMSGRDNYSMVSLLSDKYGINLVDNTSLNNYSKEFEKIILSDYGIKEKIVSNYGFDIYNPDGTINKDRLTLAMLIDSKNNNGKSLLGIINDSNASNIADYLNTNIKSVQVTPRKRDISGFTPVAAVLAAGGATAGIAAVTHNVKKKNEEKTESEKIDEIISKNTEESKNKKKNTSWIDDVFNEE